MKPLVRATFLAFACALFGGRAVAQADSSDVTARNCERATLVLSKGHPAKKELWAYSVIVQCAGGSGLLAAGWSPLPTDSVELFDLAAGSADVADVRVLNATLAVVQNASAPQSTRHIAINVLLAQYSPNISIGDEEWANPERSALGGRLDYYQVPGDQPVTSADRQRIIDAFQSLSTSDPDSQIRRVAAHVVKRLTQFCGTSRCYPPAGT